MSKAGTLCVSGAAALLPLLPSPGLSAATSRGIRGGSAQRKSRRVHWPHRIGKLASIALYKLQTICDTFIPLTRQEEKEKSPAAWCKLQSILNGGICAKYAFPWPSIEHPVHPKHSPAPKQRPYGAEPMESAPRPPRMGQAGVLQSWRKPWIRQQCQSNENHLELRFVLGSGSSIANVKCECPTIKWQWPYSILVWVLLREKKDKTKNLSWHYSWGLWRIRGGVHIWFGF